PRKSPRGFELTFSAFVAEYQKPKSNGPRVVVRSGIKCDNPDVVPVIKHTKIFFLEVSDRHAALGVLAYHINQRQRRLCANCWCWRGGWGLLGLNRERCATGNETNRGNSASNGFHEADFVQNLNFVIRDYKYYTHSIRRCFPLPYFS